MSNAFSCRWTSTPAAASKTSAQINFMGDRECRAAATAMRSSLFLTPKKDQLGEDSQRRLSENPLRILDSKDPRGPESLRSACRRRRNHFSDKSKAHFEPRPRAPVLTVGITFTVNTNLVRGFDYYTETLWEVTAGGLAAQKRHRRRWRALRQSRRTPRRPVPALETVGFGSACCLLLARKPQNVHDPRKSDQATTGFVLTQSDAAKASNFRALLRELRQANFAAEWTMLAEQ